MGFLKFPYNVDIDLYNKVYMVLQDIGLFIKNIFENYCLILVLKKNNISSIKWSQPVFERDLDSKIGNPELCPDTW